MLTNFKFKGFSVTGTAGQSTARTRGTLATKIDQFIANSSIALEAVIKASFQDMITDASKPTAKGGRMRVDTGFLRNSGKFKESSPPSGVSVMPEGFSDPEGFSSVQASIGLNKARVGELWYFGWTANYAKYRENRDGFMRVATQKWQEHVDKNSAEVKRALEL